MKAIGALSLAALLALAVAPTASAAGLEKEGDCYYLLVQDGRTRLVCTDDIADLIQEIRSFVEERVPEDEVDPGFVGGCFYTDRQDTWDPPIFCYDVNADEVCVRTGNAAWRCVPTDTPCLTIACLTGCDPAVECVPPTGGTNATYMAPLTVPVPYQERTVGHQQALPGQTVTVPSVVLVPKREDANVTTLPALGGRTCAPSELVCVNVPPLLGPTPVVVPGNDEVRSPGKTVTVGGGNVGAFVTVGAGVTVHVPGGSTGPYSVLGIVDACNQGCAWPGTPSVDPDHGYGYDVILP